MYRSCTNSLLNYYHYTCLLTICTHSWNSRNQVQRPIIIYWIFSINFFTISKIKHSKEKKKCGLKAFVRVKLIGVEYLHASIEMKNEVQLNKNSNRIMILATHWAEIFMPCNENSWPNSWNGILIEVF